MILSHCMSMAAGTKKVRMAYKRARYSRLDRAVDLIGMIGIIVPIALAFLAGRQDLMMQQLPVSISMGVLFAIYQIAE